MRTVLLALIVLILVSCKGEAASSEQIGDFKVEYLFTNEGCRIYRFHDGGRRVYFSNCKGNIETSYTTKTGKNTSTTHYEETLNSGQ